MKKENPSLFHFLLSGGVKSIFRRWIWELPQTLIGLLLVFYFTVRRRVLYSEKTEGVMIFVTKGRWGGISLGNIIIGSEGLSPVVGNQLFMHEYGHSLQSRSFGILYLFIFGLPSLLSVVFRGSNHHHSFVEKSANKLAYDYFNGKYFLEYWDKVNYPMA